jgi:cytochrome P450
MAQPTLWEQILDYSNRADPYPLYAELRKTPVARQADGSYLVSTYPEIISLLHDPRISSDLSNAAGAAAEDAETIPGLPPSFLHLDPPDHDRLRRITNRHFGPPDSPRRIAEMEPDLLEIVTKLIDGCADRTRIDVVDDLAYPFPVAVICELLGVPHEDEPRFHAWVEMAMKSFDPSLDPAEQKRLKAQALTDLSRYLAGLAEAHRRAPGSDLLSAMATDNGPEGRMSDEQIVSTALLLLIAGHETTVNLIANGVLTLLRHPDALRQLRDDPDLAIPMVEELLRYEPPVHFLPWRTTLDDIAIAGTTIPKGASVTLVLAAGSRDPDHVPDSGRFVPDRQDNEHLGFGGGVHLCFGGPLARLEAQIALTEVARRLENPRLVTDPPPYRPNPVLRGPLHLLVDIDGVAPAASAAGVILPKAREEQATERARPSARRA